MPHGASTYGTAPAHAALIDRIAAELSAHVTASLPELVARAVVVALDVTNARPASEPLYIDQRRSGLSRRQWQIRIADGRLRAWPVGRQYMTTAAELRKCIEAEGPVKPRPAESEPVQASGDLAALRAVVGGGGR